MCPDVSKNLSVFSFRVTEDEGTMILHPTTRLTYQKTSVLRVKPHMVTIPVDQTDTGSDQSLDLADGVVKGEDVPVYATKVYRGSGGY